MNLPVILKGSYFEIGQIILDYLGRLDVIKGSFEVRTESQRKRCMESLWKEDREVVHCSFEEGGRELPSKNLDSC